MTDFHSAARLHTKTVEEMSEARVESRKNAQAADKGKMTNEATLFRSPGAAHYEGNGEVLGTETVTRGRAIVGRTQDYDKPPAVRAGEQAAGSISA